LCRIKELTRAPGYYCATTFFDKVSAQKAVAETRATPGPDGERIMKTPKLLPWYARKAGVSIERAETLWRKAVREATAETGWVGNAEYWGAAMDHFLRLLEEERSTLCAPPSALGPGTWVFGAGMALGRRVLASNPTVNVFHRGFVACDRYANGETAITQVTAPVLFLLGGVDQMTPPKAAQGLIGKAREAGKVVKVLTLPVGHHQMTETPDATLAAFGRFFGPNGLLDSYFKQNLQSHVDTSQGAWRWRGPSGPEQSIAPEALQVFQRAAAVRAALFGGNSQTPMVRFQLTPLEASGDIGQAVIGLDGQTLAYTVGQTARSTDLQWMGTSGQARIEFSSPSGGNPAQYSETGPWAWFKILDQAQIQPLGSNQFRVTFQISGRQAAYELRTLGSGNPFRMRELENFRCPEQL